MMSNPKDREKLLKYRSSFFGGRLAALFGKAYLISEIKKQFKFDSPEVGDSISFFYKQRKPKTKRGSRKGGDLVWALLIGFAGLVIMFGYNDGEDFLKGLILFGGGLFMIGYFVSNISTPSHAPTQFGFFYDSLRLEKTGEFKWENISEIVVVEQLEVWKTIRLLLSNGTIVEYQFKRFNSSFPERDEPLEGQSLRLLLFVYWERGREGALI